MRYLIDADIIAFKAASSSERPVNWGDGLWTLHSFEDEAKAYVIDYLQRVVHKLGDGLICLYLTAPNNWRKEILPTYKSNRKDVRKPLVLPAIKQWMIDDLGAQIWDTFEADDILGIEATLRGGVIVSEDKDLNTIPCTIFNPAKDEDVRVISEFEADYNHMYQTLTGDTTDGYSGCPSIGPKKAEAILKGCTTAAEMWTAVVQAYSKQNLSEDVALTMARVARICRVEQFNMKTKRVRLWTPPTM